MLSAAENDTVSGAAPASGDAVIPAISGGVVAGWLRTTANACGTPCGTCGSGTVCDSTFKCVTCKPETDAEFSLYMGVDLSTDGSVMLRASHLRTCRTLSPEGVSWGRRLA